MTHYRSFFLSRLSKSRQPAYPRFRGPMVTEVAIVGGGLTVNKYKKAVKEDNLVFGRNDPRPGQPALVLLRPNRYDPNRANVAVLFNGLKRPTVEIPCDKFLHPGDQYRLMNPRDFFGKPVAGGTYQGKPITASVKGEFAAFVLLKRTTKSE